MDFRPHTTLAEAEESMVTAKITMVTALMQWLFFAAPVSWEAIYGARRRADFKHMLQIGQGMRLLVTTWIVACLLMMGPTEFLITVGVVMAVSMVGSDGNRGVVSQMQYFTTFAVFLWLAGAGLVANTLFGCSALKMISTKWMMMQLYRWCMPKLYAKNGELVPADAMARTPIKLDPDCSDNLCLWKLLFDHPTKAQARLANRSDGKMDSDLINLFIKGDIVTVWRGNSVYRHLFKGRAIDVVVLSVGNQLHAELGYLPDVAERFGDGAEVVMNGHELNRVYQHGAVGSLKTESKKWTKITMAREKSQTEVRLKSVDEEQETAICSVGQQRSFETDPCTKNNQYVRAWRTNKMMTSLIAVALVMAFGQWLFHSPGPWLDVVKVEARKERVGVNQTERAANRCGWDAIFKDGETSQFLLCDRADGMMSELNIKRLIACGEVTVYLNDGVIMNNTTPRFGGPTVFVDENSHMSTTIPKHALNNISVVVDYCMGPVGVVLPVGKIRRTDECIELTALAQDCEALRRHVDASNPKNSNGPISAKMLRTGRVAEICLIRGLEEKDVYEAMMSKPAMDTLTVTEMSRWYLSQKGWTMYCTTRDQWLRGNGDTRIAEPETSQLAWDGYKFIAVQWQNKRPYRAFNYDKNHPEGYGKSIPMPPHLLYIENFLMHVGRAYVDRGLSYIEAGVEHECDRVLIEGVPSCGKTTEISESCGKKDMVTLPSKNGAIDYAQRGVVVQTLDSIVMNGCYQTDIATLFVDEALLAHCGAIDLVAQIIKPGRMKLFGDRRQVEFVSRAGGYEMVHKWSTYPWSEEPIPRVRAWQSPIVVCDLLRPLYPDGYVNMNKIQGSLSKSRYFSPESVPGGYDMYLTYLQADRDVLRKDLGLKALTIHEAQGMRFERVCLVRMRPTTLKIYETPSYNIVAVSRTSRDFHYCTVKPDDFMSTWIREGVGEPSERKEEENFKDPVYMHFGGGHTAVDDCVTHLMRHEANSGYTEWQTAMAHVMPMTGHRSRAFVTRRVFPKYRKKKMSVPIMPAVVTLQAIQDGLFQALDRSIAREDRLMWPCVFETGVRFDTCKSARTPQLHMRMAIHPKLSTTQYDRAWRHPMDINAGLSKRVIQAPCAKVGYAPDRAIDLVAGFVRQIDLKRLKTINEELPIEGEEVRVYWYNTRGGRKQAVFKDAKPEMLSGTKYYCIIRGDHKPKLDNSHEMTVPAGQLVTAHHPFWTSLFAPMFSVLTIKIMAVLNPNIVLNTRMTWEELSGHVDHLITEERFKALELDVSKYDKSQDETMLEAECRIMKMFDMPEWAIDLWKVFHALVSLVDPYFGLRYTVGFQRRSGDAATWIGNTICLIMLMAYLYPIEDAKCCVLGGDDNLTMFSPDYKIPDVAAKAAEELNFELKTICPGKSMYFSSRLLVLLDDGWKFVADPVKIIQRMGRTDLQGHEHIQAIWESYSKQHYDYLNAQTRHAVHDAACAHYTFQLSQKVEDLMPFVNAVAAIISDKANMTRLFTGTAKEWSLSLDPTERTGGSGLYEQHEWMSQEMPYNVDPI